MSADPELRLIFEIEPEAARWRRRTMFLLSVVLHTVLIMLILVSPKLFRHGTELAGVVQVEPRRNTTFLIMPPDLQKLIEPPPTNNLSDKDRRAQGRSPIVDPNGLHMPYLRGNSPLPEIPGGTVPKPPAAVPATPSATGSAAPVPPAVSSPLPNKEEGLRLLDVKPEPQGSGAQPRLQLSTPGDAIQQSLEAAVRGRANGVPGPGDSAGQFNNFRPDFSTEAPIILSDTRGVDFGPYLTRVVVIVKRNWYAVIPESARLGEKGRVALVFEILKDGSVPQLRLVASSGAESLDRAALSSIRASNPFPPLPTAFTGDHLVLQFIYLYNMGYVP